MAATSSALAPPSPGTAERLVVGAKSCDLLANAYGDWQVVSPTHDGWGGWSVEQFEELLRRLDACTRRGTWLRLDTSSALLPTALRAGFEIHSVVDGVATLQLWRLRGADGRPAGNPTPAYAHHAMGAAAIVVRPSDGHVLAIRDR
jgi:hypothetical protein